MTFQLTQEDFDELAAGNRQPTHGVTYKEFESGFHGTRTPSKSKQYIPAFAVNDAQLQAVLLHAAVKYVFRYRQIPADFKIDLETITRLAKERHAREKAKVDASQALLQQRIYQNILSIEEAGGYVAATGAIAYRAWRLMWPNRTVASEMNLTRDVVEDVCQMLICYAEELGFQTYLHPAHRGMYKINDDDMAALFTQGNNVESIRKLTGHDQETIRKSLKRSGFKIEPHRVDCDAVVELWNQGLPITEIERRLGHTRPSIIKLLKARGLYEPERFWKTALGRDRVHKERALSN